MMMKFEFCKYTHPGSRDNNEDSIGVFSRAPGILCLVADGLGGHDAGEVASMLAVRSVAEKINGYPDQATMNRAFEYANARVLEAAGETRMKTTIAALWLTDDGVMAGNVGDSRVYQFRDGDIIFQSVDHSMAWLDIMSGDDTYKDVRDNPDRNKLVRVAGVSRGFKTDLYPLFCMPEDAFLLCSDGFWELIREDEMKSTLVQSCDAKDWLKRMCRIVHSRLDEDSDNNSAITVIVKQEGEDER